MRAFVGPEVFNCVLVDRRPEARTEDPMEAILTGEPIPAADGTLPRVDDLCGMNLTVGFRGQISRVRTHEPERATGRYLRKELALAVQGLQGLLDQRADPCSIFGCGPPGYPSR